MISFKLCEAPALIRRMGRFTPQERLLPEGWMRLEG
jgi:hypothetical protein